MPPPRLPWLVTGGGRLGTPFILHRAEPEMAEWLYQAEIRYRADETVRRRQPLRPGPQRAFLPPYEPVEEDWQ
jgi:hypothetical protein